MCVWSVFTHKEMDYKAQHVGHPSFYVEEQLRNKLLPHSMLKQERMPEPRKDGVESSVLGMLACWNDFGEPRTEARGVKG